MQLSNSEAVHAVGMRPPERGTIVEIFRRGGARALVGFEFFLAEGREGGQKKVKVERVNPDGLTFGVMDLKAKSELVKDIFAAKLSVGLATRSEDDPVIRLLERLKMDPRPFLDPHLSRPASAAREYRAPSTRLEELDPLRRSAPPNFPHESRGPVRTFNQYAAAAFRLGTPSPRRDFGQVGRGGAVNPKGRGFGPFQPNMQATRASPLVSPRPGSVQLGEGIGQMGCLFGERGNGVRDGGLTDERPGAGAEENWERFDRDFDERARERAEQQRREEREESSNVRRGQFERQWREPFQFQEPRREILRGRTWVRMRRENEGSQEEEEWQPIHEEWGMREGAERMGGADGRRRVRERREVTEGRDDDGADAWEPRGRNEIRARRQSEAIGRGEHQGPEDEDSGEEKSTGRGTGADSTKPKGNGARLESRIEAIERDRRYEKARSGLSTELRRLQSGVSPFEHPGLYSHIDQMITIHESPESHRGPMSVAGAAGDILKVPHIKLSYLAEALWEFTRRKCAETGEHLNDSQVLEIESQVLEQFGKQKVEAGKILDKAGLTGRGR
jgi:hypothetical protein